jgi:hypothetical protein
LRFIQRFFIGQEYRKALPHAVFHCYRSLLSDTLAAKKGAILQLIYGGKVERMFMFASRLRKVAES